MSFNKIAEIGAAVKNDKQNEGGGGPRSQGKEQGKEWSSDIHNKLAQKISGVTKEELKKTADVLPVRPVQRGDALGTLAKGLTDKLDWNTPVDYRSSRIAEGKKPTKLIDAKDIYPGQFVWVEGGKIIVADEMPQSLEKAPVEKAADQEKSPEEETQKTIESIELSSDENFDYVKIKSNESLSYSSEKHKNPLAIVLAIPRAKFENIPILSPGSDSGITSIETKLFNGDITLIEIGLKDDFSYEMIGDKTGIIVKISKKEKAADKADKQEAKLVPSKEELDQVADGLKAFHGYDEPATQPELGSEKIPEIRKESPAVPPAPVLSPKAGAVSKKVAPAETETDETQPEMTPEAPKTQAEKEAALEAEMEKNKAGVLARVIELGGEKLDAPLSIGGLVFRPDGGDGGLSNVHDWTDDGRSYWLSTEYNGQGITFGIDAKFPHDVRFGSSRVKGFPTLVLTKLIETKKQNIDLAVKVAKSAEKAPKPENVTARTPEIQPERQTKAETPNAEKLTPKQNSELKNALNSLQERMEIKNIDIDVYDGLLRNKQVIVTFEDKAGEQYRFDSGDNFTMETSLAKVVAELRNLNPDKADSVPTAQKTQEKPSESEAKNSLTGKLLKNAKADVAMISSYLKDKYASVIDYLNPKEEATAVGNKSDRVKIEPSNTLVRRQENGNLALNRFDSNAFRKQVKDYNQSVADGSIDISAGLENNADQTKTENSEKPSAERVDLSQKRFESSLKRAELLQERQGSLPADIAETIKSAGEKMSAPEKMSSADLDSFDIAMSELVIRINQALAESKPEKTVSAPIVAQPPELPPKEKSQESAETVTPSETKNSAAPVVRAPPALPPKAE